MTYIDDVTIATHWIPTEDSDYATSGYMYPLIRSKYDGEIVIVDNHGRDIPLYISQKGYFVRKEVGM
jgi:hypothetical protein